MTENWERNRKFNEVTQCVKCGKHVKKYSVDWRNVCSQCRREGK